MAKRTPPRNKDGTFRKRRKAATTKRKRRRNPGTMAAKAPTARRRAPTPKRAPARRRRANPPKLGLNVKTLTNGAMDAAQTLIGKAGVRLASGYLPMLPKTGAAGLAAEAAVALAIGLLADRVLGKGAARFVLAGALAAPLETAIVQANVPFLSDALSPGASTEALGRYAGYASYAAPVLAAYPANTPQPDPVAHGTSYVGYDECANSLC